MPFVEAYPLDQARPAEYNPRVITPETFELLRGSLRNLGIIKPIITTTGGLLVAGHQRTRAMKAEGYTHAPAHVLNGHIGQSDEIRFNQLHNAADLE